MYQSDRTCCVCMEPGKAVQIHHINEDPSDNAPQNLVVLCLECHNQTQLKGGFGRHLSPDLIRKYKSEWEAEMEERRREARVRALGKPVLMLKAPPSPESLFTLLQMLPEIKARACQAISEKPGRHSTNGQAQSFYRLSDLYKTILAHTLSPWDQSGSFAELTPEGFYADIAAKLYEVKRAVIMPLGTHGSMWRPIIAASVAKELSRMMVTTVSYLASAHHLEFDYVGWEKRWNDAEAILKD